jgi:polysaccharide pyruvyl transferase WcaK-like protein
VAMTQALVRRLRATWPAAFFYLPTENAALLADFVPEAIPVPKQCMVSWLASRRLSARADDVISPTVTDALADAERRLWRRLPRVSESVARLKGMVRGDFSRVGPRFYPLLVESDLVVLPGMGAINDEFADLALDYLETLAVAQQHGIPTVAFGQGIGPIKNETLRQRAAEVLPHLVRISLREQKLGPALLRQLGVPASKICVTGDDSIELAYERRPSPLGGGIGLNLRRASYSGMGPDAIRLMADVVTSFIRSHGPVSGIYPIPISSNSIDSDVDTLRELWRTLSLSTSQPTFPMSVKDVIDQAGRCRVVVAGSYHAAVFALSQGIPAICLQRSAYYASKFGGLQGRFGTGCYIVNLDEPGVAIRISDVLAEAWEAAPRLRPQLLRRAAEQIELQHYFCRSLKRKRNSSAQEPRMFEATAVSDS